MTERTKFYGRNLKTIKQLEKEYSEGLAETIREELNDVGFDFRADYGDDQDDKLEFGRKIARAFFRNMANWEKREERGEI